MGRKDTHAMNRIPPSKRIRSQIEALMNGGFEDQEDLLSQLVRWIRIVEHETT